MHSGCLLAACDCRLAIVEQAERALRLKSFDYRVLNLILYQLRGAPYDAKMLAFLRQAELLVEIEDDLKDYHKDVVINTLSEYCNHSSMICF